MNTLLAMKTWGFNVTALAFKLAISAAILQNIKNKVDN